MKIIIRLFLGTATYGFIIANTGCNLSLKSNNGATDSVKVVKMMQDDNTITVEKKATDSLKIVKRFDEKGRLTGDASLLNDTYHGPSHNYYSSGKLHSTVNYINGKKDGISTWYYENGKPYRETSYKKGKIDGIQRKYYDNGKLMAEIPYAEDEIIAGTKEYSKSGNQIPYNNNLVVNVNNQTKQYNRVFIDFKLEKKADKADYYGFLQQEGKMVKINTIKTPDGFYRIELISKVGNPGTQKITLVANAKTKMGNKILVTKEMEIVVGN